MHATTRPGRIGERPLLETYTPQEQVDEDFDERQARIPILQARAAARQPLFSDPDLLPPKPASVRPKESLESHLIPALLCGII